MKSWYLLFLKSDVPDEDLTNKPKLVAILYNYLRIDRVVEENVEWSETQLGWICLKIWVHNLWFLLPGTGRLRYITACTYNLVRFQSPPHLSVQVVFCVCVWYLVLTFEMLDLFVRNLAWASFSCRPLQSRAARLATAGNKDTVRTRTHGTGATVFVLDLYSRENVRWTRQAM